MVEPAATLASPLGALTADGVEPAGLRSGSGPRLLLVHGLGQDHGCWKHLVAELPDFETVAVDLRGHGATPLGLPSGTITQLAADLVSVLEQEGPCVCVGFSLGGVVVLLAAADRPDLVTGVVAVATSSVVGRAAADALADRLALFESGDDASIRESLRRDTVSQLAHPGDEVERITDERMAAVTDRSGYVNGARAVRSMRDYSVNDRLAEIQAPVLLVNGELDTWCPRRAAEIILEQLPEATFLEFADTGHLVTDEAPQQLATVIREWFRTEIDHE